MAKKPNASTPEEFVLTLEVLQSMAADRLLDAQALYKGERWTFAYYNAGYAVECGLKACVLSRMIYTGLVFKRSPPDCKVHDFGELIDLAGLKDDLVTKLRAGGKFPTNWGTVERWKETSRYERRGEPEARGLIEAIDGEEGVLAWLMTYLSKPA